MEIIPLVYGNLLIPMAVTPSDTENDLWKNLQEVYSKELISVADDFLEKIGDPRFYVPPINGW